MLIFQHLKRSAIAHIAHDIKSIVFEQSGNININSEVSENYRIEKLCVGPYFIFMLLKRLGAEGLVPDAAANVMGSSRACCHNRLFW